MKLKLNRRNFPVFGSCTKSSLPGHNLIVITDTFKHTRKMYQCLSDLSSHNTVHRSVTTGTSASSSFTEEQLWQSRAAGKGFAFWSSLQLRKLSLVRITEIQLFLSDRLCFMYFKDTNPRHCFANCSLWLIPPSDDSDFKPLFEHSSFLLDVLDYVVLMNW